MKKVTTDDHSITLFNDDYQEHYHSKSGAIEESVKKYVGPCKIQPGMKILDICFGLGYNVLAAIHHTKELEIISLEKDKKVLEELQDIEIEKEYQEDFKIIKKVAQELEYQKENLKIKIILGDAKETIKEVDEKFDAIFLDPFSPPKNPELWTEEFFQELYRVSKKGTIISTYSCARKVRENLKTVGFKVSDGPIIGRRSPSTLAEK